MDKSTTNFDIKLNKTLKKIKFKKFKKNSVDF